MNTHGYAQRAQALRVPCEFCHSPIDEECYNRKGEPLDNQPAHLKRLRAAGVDPAAKAVPDLGCDDDPQF